MARLKLGEFVRPLEPIEWPDGTEQEVKHLTWVEQEMLADMEADAVSVRDTMPKLMPLVLPGRITESQSRTAATLLTMVLSRF